MANTPAALIVATMDTKGQEAMFLVECLKAECITVKRILKQDQVSLQEGDWHISQ